MAGVSRCLLVGILVTTLAVDCAATGRLFRRRCCSRVCQPASPKPCSATPDCSPEPTVLDGCSACSSETSVPCETAVEDSCLGCTASSSPDSVSEYAVEELITPTPAPIETFVPESIEAAADNAAISAVNPPDSQTTIPPAPVASPKLVESPAAITPAPITPAPTFRKPTAPTSDAVGDRYSNSSSSSDLFDTPAPAASTPAPAEAPAEESPESMDLFDEPATNDEEEEEPAAEVTQPEPEQDKPGAEDAQPELDTSDLFGPPASDPDPQEAPPADDATPEPEPSEAEPSGEAEAYDPFEIQHIDLDQESRTLSEPGGLRSKLDRTWADETASFQCEARLVKVSSKGVILRRVSGRELAVPFARLCQSDLLFVRQQMSAMRVIRAREAAAEKLAVAWTRSI